MKYALTEGAKRVGGGVNLGHSLSPPSHFMLATGLYLESEKDSATVCTWHAKLRGSTNKFVGYVGSVEEAMTVMRQYELETTTKFSCFKSDKMFGSHHLFRNFDVKCFSVYL